MTQNLFRCTIKTDTPNSFSEDTMRIIVSVMEEKVSGVVDTYTVGTDVPDSILTKEKGRKPGEISSLELHIDEYVRSVIKDRVRQGNDPRSHSVVLIP